MSSIAPRQRHITRLCIIDSMLPICNPHQGSGLDTIILVPPLHKGFGLDSLLLESSPLGSHDGPHRGNGMLFRPAGWGHNLYSGACTDVCRSQSVSLHGTSEPVKADLALMPASSTPITHTSLSVPTLPPEGQADSALMGPLPSASPSMQRRSPWEEEDWSRPSVELVTYELELDTASCKVTFCQSHLGCNLAHPSCMSSCVISYIMMKTITVRPG